jgi:hypothetical protein
MIGRAAIRPVFRLARETRGDGIALGARHIAAHHVTLDEVREAILERPYWSVPGRDGTGRDGTTLVYGRTYAGRYLMVVAVDEGGQAFVVTARDMTDAEKKTFRRKAR